VYHSISIRPVILFAILKSLFDTAVECGSLPIIRHGYVSSSPADTTYGHEAVYGCQRGYWFSQQVFTRVSACDVHGAWTNVTSCVRKSTTNTHFTALELLVWTCENTIVSRRNCDMRNLQFQFRHSTRIASSVGICFWTPCVSKHLTQIAYAFALSGLQPSATRRFAALYVVFFLKSILFFSF